MSCHGISQIILPVILLSNFFTMQEITVPIARSIHVSHTSENGFFMATWKSLTTVDEMQVNIKIFTLLGTCSVCMTCLT